MLQQTSATFHGIDLIDYTPFRVSPYALTPSKTEFAKKQIGDMLKQGLIRLSDSPYNSPIVIVEYKDDSREPRFCIDFSKLNKLTLDTNCPALNIHDLVRKVGSSKVFCKIDLKKGYWQIPLTGDSKPLTAFTGPDGIHYEFNVMPFGLKGAPGTFIRLMNMVLSGLIGTIAEVYLDDILVHAETHEALLDNLLTVFSRLRQHQLTVHLKKCEFGVTEVEYLGHNLTAEHNSAPTAQVRAIQEFPIPRNKKELQSFLGTCNWLRLYVPEASVYLSPLHNITTRKTFKWTQTDQEHFDKAKLAFADLKPLHRPDPTLPYVLQTDACMIGVAATLMQESQGERRIISNVSATLSGAELRYSSNEKECLAIVWALDKFRPYLEGQKFILRTDNKALTWLNISKNQKMKFQRWAVTIQEFNFEIQHIPGKMNQLPDAMSRNPTEELAKDFVPSVIFPTSAHSFGSKKTPPTLSHGLVTPRSPPDPSSTSEIAPLSPSVPPPGNFSPDSFDVCSVINVKFAPRNDTLFKRIKQAQNTDDESQEFRIRYLDLLTTPISELTTSDQKFLSRYQLINEHVYYFKSVESGWLLFVPKSMRRDLLLHYHNDPLYNHPGSQALEILVSQFYYWPNVSKDIKLIL